MQYNRKDRFYLKAKEEGFNSRAAYKLLELQKKFKLIRYGATVIELGCWPGGWLQVLSEAVGPTGKVLGIDLKECVSPAPNVATYMADIADFVPPDGVAQFDVVLSDMSPKISGIQEKDRAAAVSLAEMAIAFASRYLKPGGSFVCKLFKSAEADNFARDAKPLFESCKRVELESTRTTSNEIYFVGKGFKGANKSH